MSSLGSVTDQRIRKPCARGQIPNLTTTSGSSSDPGAPVPSPDGGCGALPPLPNSGRFVAGLHSQPALNKHIGIAYAKWSILKGGRRRVFRSVDTQMGILLFETTAPVGQRCSNVITGDTLQISGPVIAIHVKEQQSNQDLLFKGYIDLFFFLKYCCCGPFFLCP